MSIFDEPVGILASRLLNRDLELPSGEVITIIETQHYTRAENENGVYKPLLDLDPSSVLSPRVMGHPMFLIAGWDRVNGEDKLGGCVLIRAIDTDRYGLISGPGKVGRAVGFTQKLQTGWIKERDREPLLLTISGVVEPKVTIKGDVKLSTRVIKKYMGALTEVYLRDSPSVSLADWLEELKRTHKTETRLKAFLGLED